VGVKQKFMRKTERYDPFMSLYGEKTSHNLAQRRLLSHELIWGKDQPQLGSKTFIFS